MNANVWVKLANFLATQCEMAKIPDPGRSDCDGCPVMYMPMGAMRLEEGWGEFYLLC